MLIGELIERLIAIEQSARNRSVKERNIQEPMDYPIVLAISGGYREIKEVRLGESSIQIVAEATGDTL